jgi:hypothetical protein
VSGTEITLGDFVMMNMAWPEVDGCSWIALAILAVGLLFLPVRRPWAGWVCGACSGLIFLLSLLHSFLGL